MVQVAHVLTVGGIFFLANLLYTLGTLTTALILGYYEFSSSWWTAWFGVWVIGPLYSLIGNHSISGFWQMAILMYTFGTYCLFLIDVWTLLVSFLILVICAFYIQLSLQESFSKGKAYFNAEAQGTQQRKV